MEKYEQLRNRLLELFFFNGRIASHIYLGNDGKKIKFADQTIYLGQALMVFSSEVAVHAKLGIKESNAKSILHELLSCFEELEAKGNARYSPSGDSPGFFVRDDISGASDPRLHSKFVEVESDWQFPEKENDSPSTDQIIGLMSGLLSVVRFSDDSSLSIKARAISSRLFDYARRNDFILLLPNGKRTARGWDCRGFASLLHGLNMAITGLDHFDSCFFTPFPALTIRQSLKSLAAFWDSPITTQAILALGSQELKIPLTDISLPRKSYVLHMLLMLLASSGVWSQSDVEILAISSNHHLAALLYSAYHHTPPIGILRSYIEEILTSCPLDGPSQNVSSNSGWQHDNRWVRCSDIYEPSEGDHCYNGLDWLLLRNVSILAYAS